MKSTSRSRGVFTVTFEEYNMSATAWTAWLLLAVCPANTPVETVEAFARPSPSSEAADRSNLIDGDELARRVLGARERHFAPHERARLSRVLRRYVASAYRQLEPQRWPTACALRKRRGPYAEVGCVLELPDYDPVPVSFRLKRTTGWRIYDIEADSISATRDNARLVARAIDALGVDGFLRRLERRIAIEELQNARRAPQPNEEN